MSKRFKRMAAATCLLMLAALGCAGGEPAPAEEAATPTATGEAAATPAEDLPLVIAPVSGAFEDAPQPDRYSDDDLAALRAAAAAAPDDAAAQRELAIALHGSKLREEAIPYFERAAELSPGVRSWLDLALAYNSLARIADAEAAYARILAVEPGHPVALHNLGAIAAKRGDLEGAIDYYRRSLASDPGYLLAQYHLASALERTERYEDAYRAYGRVVNEMEPADGEETALIYDALYRMASLDIKMGAYPRAAQMLALLVEENPNHDSAHYAYGQVLLQLGRTEEAQHEFEEHMRVLSEQHPQSPVAMGD
jgi:tetratricopeptide (TPR) repeat protein